MKTQKWNQWKVWDEIRDICKIAYHQGGLFRSSHKLFFWAYILPLKSREERRGLGAKPAHVNISFLGVFKMVFTGLIWAHCTQTLKQRAWLFDETVYGRMNMFRAAYLLAHEVTPMRTKAWYDRVLFRVSDEKVFFNYLQWRLTLDVRREGLTQI